MRVQLLAGVLAMVLGGCGGTYYALKSNVITMHSLPFKGDGSVIWVSNNPQASQEARLYADLVAQHLRSAGYNATTETPATPPRYIASLTYGVDNGREVEEIFSIPDYGVTGYVGTTTGRVANRLAGPTLEATTTIQPRYGVTGYSTRSVTAILYTRKIILSVYDYSKISRDNPDGASDARVYTGAVISEGHCDAFLPIMSPLLGELMRGFPGSNVSSRVMDLRIENYNDIC
jgi:hypothetical protein